MQINNELSENNNEVNNNVTTNFAFKHCYLANSTKKTLYNTSTDTTYTYFVNAAKTIGLNVDADREEYDKAKSFRSQYPINEFTDGEYGIVAAFPHVFMFAMTYNKNVSDLTLMQFSAIPVTCQMLIFYLFDIQRRHGNIRGMSTCRKADSSKLNDFAEELCLVLSKKN